MLKVKGTYNEAIVYAKTVEDLALEQIKNICSLEVFKDSKIRIMPDVHAGAGCTIGTTMTISDAVIPNLVGVDIGCGMETVLLKEKEIDFAKLDQVIHSLVPAGRNIRETAHEFSSQVDLNELHVLNYGHVKLDRAVLSIGTLGGGNHFIEIDRDDEGNLYLVVHTGSRHLGTEIANLYQKLSSLQRADCLSSQIDEMIRKLKEEGREQEIESALKQRKATLRDDALAWCTDQLFADYIHDMKLVQYFAELNRKAIVKTIVDAMGFTVIDSFTTIHNYIDTEEMILRKGSVSAKKGEKLLIPINMRDGSLICIGKGNEDWNCSAPHGAGRLLSRRAAKRQFSLENYKEAMEGIYTTTVNSDTLDECPMAYKPIEEILEQVEGTVTILKKIKPIYNFKASE